MIFFTKEQAYLPIVQAAAAKYNVPVALILGHIKQESGFNPNAYNPSDPSWGIMMMLLPTARSMDQNATSDKLYDPAYAIDLGTRYIAKNLAMYGGDIKPAIAAYNAGSAYLDANGHYISKSGNTAVQNYVDRVYKYYQEYTEWLGKGAKEVDITMIDPLLAGGFVIAAGLVFFAIYQASNSRRYRYVRA